MQNSTIQEIKEKVDIVDVVKDYLTLQKSGANYRAVCPFHSEDTPSFFVSPSRQMFKCFGCGKQGSVFDFIMEIEGIEFRPALEMLAKRAGVELKEPNPQLKSEYERLGTILELATQFYRTQLNKSSPGQRAKEYLANRGINDYSLQKWRIGFAPNEWRVLSDFLVSKGYRREEIVKAGLAVKSEKSSTSYDRFRGRIIFPIFDLASRVVAFGGRSFEESSQGNPAKYINLPNTLLYNKSKTLYGLNYAKVEIRKKGGAILTEGYTDVILAHQAGWENAVASSGTSLTSEQLSILKRYTDKLFIAFDMDLAGNIATTKGIDMAQSQNFEVKVIEMPEDQDPADIIARDPKEWSKLIENAQDIFEFYFKTAFSQFDKDTPEGKRRISEVLLPKIKRISNKILQSHWVQELSKRLGIDEEPIFEELRKMKLESSGANQQRGQESKKSPASSNSSKTRRDHLEEKVLAILFISSDYIENLSKEDFSLFSNFTKKVIELINQESGAKEVFKKMENLEEEMQEKAKSIAMKAEAGEIELPSSSEEIKKELCLCIEEVRKLVLRERLQELSNEIKKAEAEGNNERVQQLTKEFSQKTGQLKNFIQRAKSF